MEKRKRKGKEHTKRELTTLRSDLEAVGKFLLEARNWILAHISLVQTNTMNIVLTANPITVITRLIPAEIITPSLSYLLRRKESLEREEKRVQNLSNSYSNPHRPRPPQSRVELNIGGI